MLGDRLVLEAVLGVLEPKNGKMRRFLIGYTSADFV